MQCQKTARTRSPYLSQVCENLLSPKSGETQLGKLIAGTVDGYLQKQSLSILSIPADSGIQIALLQLSSNMTQGHRHLWMIMFPGSKALLTVPLPVSSWKKLRWKCKSTCMMTFALSSIENFRMSLLCLATQRPASLHAILTRPTVVSLRNVLLNEAAILDASGKAEEVPAYHSPQVYCLLVA